MYDEDIAPTSITCDAVLNAWARRGTIEGAERAEQILERMEYIRTKGKRVNIQPTSYSFATVISAWAKAAKIGETYSGDRAQHILEIMNQEGPDSEYAKSWMHGQEQGHILLEQKQMNFCFKWKKGNEGVRIPDWTFCNFLLYSE